MVELCTSVVKGKMASRIFYWMSCYSNNDRSGALCLNALNCVKLKVKWEKYRK